MAERRNDVLVKSLSHVTKSGVPYRRAADVERQITSTAGLSTSELIARSRIRDRRASEYLKEESLVYHIRLFYDKGDSDTVNALTDALLRRCAAWAVARFRALGLDHTGADEAYRDLVADVFGAIVDGESDRGEFFQVRFWRALRYRLINVYDRHLRSLNRTELHESLDYRGSITSDDTGESSDASVSLEERIDSGVNVATDVEQRLAIREGLFAIRDVRHREAFVLRYFEEWPQDAPTGQPCLSRYFGVTVKTIYNWLRTAEADLESWRKSRSGQRTRVEEDLV